MDGYVGDGNVAVSVPWQVLGVGVSASGGDD